MKRDEAALVAARATATTPAQAAPAAGGARTEDLEAGARWPARLELHAERATGGPAGAEGRSGAEGGSGGAGGEDDVGRGATTRVRSAHHGPLRLLKTLYPEGPGVAHAVLVHPPGGLVGGDRLDVQVNVDIGAHLLLTNPAATRFYRSVAGVAAQRVTARVAAGARLEWLPQETLAYDGCDALNRWQVRLEGDASLIAMEVLALGLGAAGKPFLHGRFVQQFEIEGLWREHGVIDAQDAALLDGPCGLAGHRVLGTLVLAAGEVLPQSASEAALEAARTVLAAASAANGGEAPHCLGGATLLHGRLLVVRVLAHEVEVAMSRLRRVRAHWRRACWDLAPHEPRIWAS